MVSAKTTNKYSGVEASRKIHRSAADYNRKGRRARARSHSTTLRRTSREEERNRGFLFFRLLFPPPRLLTHISSLLVSWHPPLFFIIRPVHVSFSSIHPPRHLSSAVLPLLLPPRPHSPLLLLRFPVFLLLFQTCFWWSDEHTNKEYNVDEI